jgi:hypothetical protein
MGGRRQHKQLKTGTSDNNLQFTALAISFQGQLPNFPLGCEQLYIMKTQIISKQYLSRRLKSGYQSYFLNSQLPRLEVASVDFLNTMFR